MAITITKKVRVLK